MIAERGMRVSRRRFIQGTVAGATLIGGPRDLFPASQSRDETASATTPWYRRAYRWGQTNITEKDPVRYDIAWWRGYWKRTAGAGRHHQRRRHRRVLPEQVPAAPSRRVPRTAAICSAS